MDKIYKLFIILYFEFRMNAALKEYLRAAYFNKLFNFTAYCFKIKNIGIIVMQSAFESAKLTSGYAYICVIYISIDNKCCYIFGMKLFFNLVGFFAQFEERRLF